MKGAVAVRDIDESILEIQKFQKYKLPIYTGELWTSKQRQMHPIHYTISYRASFKPELPHFFINKYCKNPGSIVLDPFGGRGTTIIQANLMGFNGIHNDVNNVSHFLAASRQQIPTLDILINITESLELNSRRINLTKKDQARLLPFFHKDTLNEIINLRKQYLSNNLHEDPALYYIVLTALSRLYGHSNGFFSVYTFPQISIMPGAQRRNNKVRGQKPEYRNVQERIIRKMKRDLSKDLPICYHNASKGNSYYCNDARNLESVKNASVDLVVTSPPFLNKVNYFDDNWMRAWFLGLEKETEKSDITMTSDIDEWAHFMEDVIREIGRVLKPGGRAVVEVGEVKHGGSWLNLEEAILSFLPMKVEGGRLLGERLYINKQSFTKLANCWDVKNNKLGTNTNRCLVILKD